LQVEGGFECLDLGLESVDAFADVKAFGKVLRILRGDLGDF
jgi:hypothetical protein